MIRFLLFAMLLGCCIPADAQLHLYTKDSSVVGEVTLPANLPLVNYQRDNSSGQYIYLLSDHDVYHLFGYDTMQHFRDFDFSNFHILGINECRQCLRVCKHDQGQTACHRNRCQKQWIWFKRRNQTAFANIPLISPTSSIAIGLPDQHNYNLKDTLLFPASTNENAPVRWYSHSMGDCHGRFTYQLLKDQYHPVVILKEFSHYGGCRAAGSINVIVEFMPVKGIQYYLKNTILDEKL